VCEVQALVDKPVTSLSGPVPPVTVRVIVGTPAAELIDAASDADRLVLGSRSSGGFGPPMLGSVSSQVVRTGWG
jgi:nucleotide-binding universal stress UspA family protein